MARAKVVPVVPVLQNVILELTPEEAEALVRITYRVGGLPDTTRRGKIDAIREALVSVGYDPSSHDDERQALTGNLTFNR